MTRAARALSAALFVLLGLPAFATPPGACAADARASAPGTERGALPRSLTLTEGWRFQPDPTGAGDGGEWWRPGFDRSGWRAVTVPMAWDEYDPAMDGYEGVGWYALDLPADAVVDGARQRLLFHRVNNHARVWIDGHEAGSNLNGYVPFEIDVTPWAEPGRPATIVVRVENGTRYDWLPGTPIVEWVQYGGLLEPVDLVTTAPASIRNVTIRARPAGTTGRVTAVVEVGNDAGVPFRGTVTVEAAGRAARSRVRIDAGARESIDVGLVLPDARLWTLDDPHLYSARVTLADARGAIDAVETRFGVRSIEARGRALLLNGLPIHVRGVNRYDEFPHHGPVVPPGVIRADLEAVKAAGANVVRVHYPQSPAHLEIADEIGLLYMEEIPLNWWRAAWHPKVPPEYDNDRIIDEAEKTLVAMVRRDAGHPSLMAWSMSNECQTADSLGVHAMERLLTRAKALDPSRPVTYVANRRFEQNAAFAKADFVAVNLYYGMWDGAVAARLAEVEDSVYVPTRTRLEEILRLFPGQPVVLSEFGTIGVPGSGGDVRFSEDYQAAYVSAVWRAVQAVPDVAGGIVWSWADYRQRQGFTNDFPTCFGPFGIVTLERKPKKALDALRALWLAEAQSR